MKKIDKTIGQRINYKLHNDNAPPSYSSPGALFKIALHVYANRNCSRCGGTGYIGGFKSIASGRCFQCLPDKRWNEILGELALIGTDDNSGEAVCEIRFVSSNVYSSIGYIVTRVGIPPTGSTPVFSTVEEARKFASEMYGV